MFVNTMKNYRCLSTALALGLVASAMGQSVILPAPRLLTTLPMGGKVGTTFEITISGDDLDGMTGLHFSHPSITAKAAGKNKFAVTIASDAPTGIHEARVMARLGISTCRAFTVGAFPEVTQNKPNQSLAQAMELKLGTVCNAVMSTKAVDYYSFTAQKGQRVVVECASRGIDSRMNAVLIIADAEGRDLEVDRLGGLLDFTAPADGKFIIKVHELTYKGGAHYFYRLVLSGVAAGAPVPRHPTALTVSSFSWRPIFEQDISVSEELEPNNQFSEAQKISVPCQIDGRFFPAADVDTFEFTAKKGEEWWVEVVSERLGLPTDPFVLVQHVDEKGKATDVAELDDIAPPIKPSGGGYSYDGPPYNAGSADVLGKLIIKKDGLYRLQIRDLFGGTRSVLRHRYRLIVRKAQPDFTLVAWALHMNLRNGDRNALSKPVALRNGRTMAFEVVAVRRDGFTGAIELGIEGLPAGMSAHGFRIPKGKTRGIVTITAADNAPRSLATAKLFGRATLNGEEVRRPCELASMRWPVKNHNSDIPAPRLFADLPVSVGGGEPAPITIRAAEKKVWEAKAGGKLTIPLQLIRRGEFSGSAIQLKAFGVGFEKCSVEAGLKSDTHDAVLDLAALKIPVGEHTIAFYGRAVSKYAPPTKSGKPAKKKDIVDIVVSEPITIRVLPADKK
jgi:hypothetical protein